MMTESTAKPKAKRASRASGARKPAAKATKTASAGTKAKGPAKPGAKAKVRKGEMVKPASRLIDSSREGNMRRAIDIHEGEKVDAGAFKALVKAAVAQNGPP